MPFSATAFRRDLLRWYDRARRDLPWRQKRDSSLPIDPYHVLVSELMLQQTQVATVIPYFNRFIAMFPDLKSLAVADEQQVLRLWQGLGYYSRARNLLAAAKRVVSEHGGQLPDDPAELLKLPGVGRYTAGAVTSIAFGRPAPIVDGNVARVLCRIDAIESDPRVPATLARLWHRAEQILPRKRVGDFNSALMELGALICTPRSPKCLTCPIHIHCRALAAGMQDRIPPPRLAKPLPLLRRRTLCIRRGERWLIEQRPSRGRWAGMWQFITVDAEETNVVQTRLPPRSVRLGTVSHALTHRRYEFEVYIASDRDTTIFEATSARKWVTLDGLADYPLPRPHLVIAQMLRSARGGDVG